MATPRIEIAPELVAEGRRLYEQTLTPMHYIAAMMGISRRTLENRIREWNWTTAAPLERGGRSISCRAWRSGRGGDRRDAAGRRPPQAGFA